MRDLLAANSQAWTRKLNSFLFRCFPGLDSERDDLVSDAFFEVIRDLARISERYATIAATDPTCKKSGFLYACLKLAAKHKALSIINSPRRRNTRSLNETGEFEENIGNWRPTATVQPEQEHVVFLRQMMEFCRVLPSDEALVMGMVLDRATMQEILEETGLSISELTRRRGSAMRRLSERVGTI